MYSIGVIAENEPGFQVNVGVAYGTDTEKVKELLLDCAKDHNQISKYPSPIVGLRIW